MQVKGGLTSSLQRFGLDSIHKLINNDLPMSIPVYVHCILYKILMEWVWLL